MNDKTEAKSTPSVRTYSEQTAFIADSAILIITHEIIACYLVRTPDNSEAYEISGLAEFVQHIPDKYQHLVHYYGYYSNKSREVRLKKNAAATASPPSAQEPLSQYRTQCRITWAALIKCIFEVDPLKCPHCGASMRIVAVIDKSNSDVVQKILKHCGLWNNPPPPRAPPSTVSSACGEAFNQLIYDDSFFSQLVN